MQVDVRVIVATNKDLADGVRQGVFREDLYYRIHVIPILLPPLRSRREDIPLLVEHFLRKYGTAMDKDVRAVAPGAMQLLLGHDWPGNVRELENAIEYAVAMTREDVISEVLFPGLAAVVPREAIKTLKQARDSFEKEYLTQLLQITNGTVSTAANLAGKYRADFYHLLKKHGIDPAEYKKQH